MGGIGLFPSSEGIFLRCILLNIKQVAEKIGATERITPCAGDYIRQRGNHFRLQRDSVHTLFSLHRASLLRHAAKKISDPLRPEIL